MIAGYEDSPCARRNCPHLRLEAAARVCPLRSPLRGNPGRVDVVAEEHDDCALGRGGRLYHERIQRCTYLPGIRLARISDEEKRRLDFCWRQVREGHLLVASRCSRHSHHAQHNADERTCSRDQFAPPHPRNIYLWVHFSRG